MYNLSSSIHYNSRITKAVKWIIITNISVLFISLVFRNINLSYAFGLVPGNVITKFSIWQLATYMFLHSGVWHLLINMLILYFFGCNLERAWGSKRFLKYYFLTGIGAGICSIITSPGSFIPIVGASGAIFGVLVAYAILFPETVVLMFFIFPMKIKHAVFIFAAVDLFAALSNTGSGIAYFAHIGGGLTGYLYLKKDALLLNIAKAHYKKQQEIKRKKEIEGEELDVKVDEILDKISKHGMQSLSFEEKKLLNRKSKRL